MFVFRLLKDYFHFRALAIVILAGKVNSKFCNGGISCPPSKDCCPVGCCLVVASSGYRPTVSQVPETTQSMPHYLLWNHWLLWGLLTLLLLLCLCGCGLWKKRQFFVNRFSRRSSRNEEERSDIDSTGSCYPPPQYSRCSSFHYAPPPYTEVTSKPDLYPLVISYRSDNGKFGDNCLMVQYFRNYVVHPALGSLSAGSTVESISSSFFGQSVQESDSNFPPTYEESRIEERNLNEVETVTAPTPLRCQPNHFITQGQIIRNTGCENSVENNTGIQNNEMQQGIVENIHQSIQKASTTVAGLPKLKSTLPATFKNFKTLQNSAQSLPSNLYSEPTKNPKKVIRPSNLYLSTFKRINKSVILSNSTDSINENNGYAAHQYSSDVILAQPQSYCESNNELHYYSSDILNNPNHFLQRVNDSYSSEDNLSQPRGSLQDFVSSDGLSHSQFSNLEMNNFSTSSDVSSLQGCGSPDSPPQATSPTGEFRNLLDKIQQLPIQNSTRSLESKTFDLFNYKNQVPFAVGKTLEDSEELSESESAEKSCLLNESAQSVLKFKPKKLTAIRPNKLLCKQTLPSRSKTFYMPFCHSSLSLRRNSNCKVSTSAPVTPVTNFPSPGSVALSFSSNPNKFGSKKSLEVKADGRPLLNDEDEGNDEVF